MGTLAINNGTNDAVHIKPTGDPPQLTTFYEDSTLQNLNVPNDPSLSSYTGSLSPITNSEIVNNPGANASVTFTLNFTDDASGDYWDWTGVSHVFVGLYGKMIGNPALQVISGKSYKNEDYGAVTLTDTIYGFKGDYEEIVLLVIVYKDTKSVDPGILRIENITRRVTNVPLSLTSTGIKQRITSSLVVPYASGNTGGAIGSATGSSLSTWTSVSGKPFNELSSDFSVSNGALNVNINTDDVPEGTGNLYHTAARVQGVVSGAGVFQTLSTTDNVNFGTGSFSGKITAAQGTATGEVITAGRSVSSGNGLSGGGALTQNRTISLGTPSGITLSSTNSLSASSHTHALDLSGRILTLANDADGVITFNTNAQNLGANRT